MLAVDDDPGVGAIAVGLLRELGYYTLAAESIGTALRLVEIHSEIDLILTDLFLGGGNLGSRLIDILRPQLGYKLRCVIMPASPLMEQNQLDRLPVDCVFLPKPFGRTELAKAVRDALAD